MTTRTIGTPEQHAAALRIARRFSSRIPEHLAPDIENAALFALWQALQKEETPNFPYLRSRIRGACIDRLRELDFLSRIHRHELSEAGEEMKHVGDDLLRLLPSELDIERHLDLLRVLHAVDSLRPAWKFVVHGHLIGKKHREMASELGLSQGRISQMLSEAASVLRDRLLRKIAGGG